MAIRRATRPPHARRLLGNVPIPSGRVWDAAAPRSLREEYRYCDDRKGWAAWARRLASRKVPTPLWEVLGTTPTLLTWGIPLSWLPETSSELLPTLARWASTPPSRSPARRSTSRRRTGASREAGKLPEVEAVDARMRSWLAQRSPNPRTVDYSLECLAWAHALPRLVAAASPDVWWAALERLIEEAIAASDVPVTETPLPVQLLGGELALTLAYLFPELGPCRMLRSRARRVVESGIDALLDGEGLPHGSHHHLMRPLLACWTRCRATGGASPRVVWGEGSQVQYEWLVRHALRLTRHDGSEALSEPGRAAWEPDLFAAALHFGGDDDDRDIGALILPRHRKLARAVTNMALPETSLHSEWAGTAILRLGWRRADPWLAVVYSGREVRVELHCDRDVVFSGPWQLDLLCDGRPVEIAGPWEEVCWTSDEDGDYLEIEAAFSAGVRVQRQMFLARADGVLLLADCVLWDAEAQWNYRGRLPLPANMRFEAATESREGFLTGGRRRALVLPLALPEWRAEAGIGQLAAKPDGLELSQSAEGAAMFAPLWFDLDPRRMARPATWRRLTVAEDRQVAPDATAVGYRAMTGRRQWLIYRSLGPNGNRTLLGHNLVSQTLVARFLPSGEVEPLLEVE
jgi:hypothetical protein